MTVTINNFSRLTVREAVLIAFLMLNGNDEKVKERHVRIEKGEKTNEIVFTVKDE